MNHALIVLVVLVCIVAVLGIIGVFLDVEAAYLSLSKQYVWVGPLRWKWRLAFALKALRGYVVGRVMGNEEIKSKGVIGNETQEAASGIGEDARD